ncbi:hypothetical protein [Phaeobacter inhibens]|uniref:hypothetical protein n=1 Tax=Phaeobacter inhibens TaxID=221822 RepID=UPI0021A36BD8|nr:hypothetical protein [Phaeobacter inhibens]UWR57345.1 hypothetical protein K4F89_02480 [Phaeobacter inhibens]UWR76903.1 hypothetical protein K4L04_02795 [Phaeobacter inhibens]
MPNALAYLMLIAWPVITYKLFQRVSLQQAILWCVIGGYLFLPPLAVFDLPLVPDMDKDSIPAVVAFVICAYILRKRVEIWPRHPVMRALVAIFLGSVIATVLTNGDPIVFRVIENAEPIVFPTYALPGLRWRDLGSVMINQMIVLLPFFLARRYLSHPDQQRQLVMVLMVAGLIYSIPSLFEVRFSPQINTWVYGFFQHDFSQTMRQGGFRPIVFLPHSLWLALFMLMSVLAATALARSAEDPDRRRYTIAAVYLFGVLVLCKSIASLVYGLIFTPFVAMASYRMQMRLALALGVVAIVYPMLRNLGLVPVDAILAQAQAFSPERAQSLGFRFTNEALMLDRAADKPWFGWGGWGRNLVRNLESGEIESIPDGRWILVFGTFGWVGYIAEMGLLAGPLVLLWQQVRRHAASTLSPFAAPLALMLAATLVDMLLNATLTPVTWLCAGSVLGYAERLRYPGLFTPKRQLFDGHQALATAPPPRKRRSVL